MTSSKRAPRPAPRPPRRGSGDGTGVTDDQRHLAAVPDPKPTRFERAASRLSMSPDGLKIAIGGAAMVLAVSAAAVGGMFLQNRRVEQRIADPRGEELRQHERDLLGAFLANGDAELSIDSDTITTLPGTVTITKTGDNPIRVRSTPDRQEPVAGDGSKLWEDNVIAEADKVVFPEGAFVVTTKDGERFVGGIARGANGNLPVVATPEAVAEATAWVDIGRIEGNEFSGAVVQNDLDATAPYAVSLRQDMTLGVARASGGGTMPTMTITKTPS